MVKISHVQSAICGGFVANGKKPDSYECTSLDPGSSDNFVDSEHECSVKYSRWSRTDI